MAPPPPELIEDFTAEILLRLQPDEPEHLVRALLVCKPWLRVISEPGFLRRYRAFHGTPPLLGLLHRLRGIDGFPNPSLAPTTAVPLFPYPDFWYSEALDCRHGRVLLLVRERGWSFLVWDPVTGDLRRVPDIDIPRLTYTAAVICAASGCDHLICNGGPFRVMSRFRSACTRRRQLRGECWYALQNHVFRLGSKMKRSWQPVYLCDDQGQFRAS